MTDILDILRLRGRQRVIQPEHDIMLQAADEIERLRRELETESAYKRSYYMQLQDIYKAKAKSYG